VDRSSPHIEHRHRLGHELIYDEIINFMRNHTDVHFIDIRGHFFQHFPRSVGRSVSTL